ncbi:hypothetical protein Bca4012_030048 [Brassica carinata]
MFGEMHPLDLKMLETNSSVRGSGGSFRGKSQASSSNTTEGNSRSHVVVMAGRWIMYDNGGWDFKIDNERMGRAVDFSQSKGVNGLKDSILASYGLLGRDLEVEMCYWLIDGESEMVGKGAAPVEIATDTDYKIFKALHRTDKSCNVFVTFREIVGEKLIFLRSERDILSQMDASLGMDDDEFLIWQVEAVEASFGLNSQTAEGVQGSKDKDSGAAVDGVNSASGNMLQQEKQKSCALGTVVENGSKMRAHVEAAEDAVCGVNSDNMHQQNCKLQEKEKNCGEGTVVENGSKKRANVEAVSEENKKDHLAKENEDDEDYDDNEDEYEDEDDDDAEDGDEDEGDGGNEDKDDVGNEDEDEDDKDYDYNGWHEFVGNDCERDEDDDFDGCPPKGGRDGLVVTVMSVLWSPKLEVKGLEEANDNLRDFVCTSRIVDSSYTEDSDIFGSVDVVNVTPPKDRNQQNHDDDSVDRRFTKSSSETRNEKRSHVIEDDDEYFDPTLTDATQVHGGGATKTGTLSCAHNDETPSGESGHIVLVTPQKQYNKHNRVIEADDEFVSPPFTQTTEFEGGEACIPRKHFPSTSVTVSCTQADETDTGASVDLGQANPPEKHNTHSRVIEDEDLFVDPPVRIRSQV